VSVDRRSSWVKWFTLQVSVDRRSSWVKGFTMTCVCR
jgi:hypothetical protein